MKKITSLLIFAIFLNVTFSQNTDVVAYVGVQNYEIKASSIKLYKNPQEKDFEGSYHFGESEGESNLDILYSNNKFYARTEYADWENNTWVGKSERLRLMYKNGKITIDQVEYELATKEKTKGLKSSYTKVTENNKNTLFIQFNPGNEIERPKGKYPETSFVKLTRTELAQYSKNELKIIRNEIFARNGHIFKKNGEMFKYFSKKEWYKLLKKRRNFELSAIEKQNVDLIIELEQN